MSGIQEKTNCGLEWHIGNAFNLQPHIRRLTCNEMGEIRRLSKRHCWLQHRGRVESKVAGCHKKDRIGAPDKSLIHHLQCRCCEMYSRGVRVHLCHLVSHHHRRRHPTLLSSLGFQQVHRTMKCIVMFTFIQQRHAARKLNLTVFMTLEVLFSASELLHSGRSKGKMEENVWTSEYWVVKREATVVSLGFTLH